MPFIRMILTRTSEPPPAPYANVRRAQCPHDRLGTSGLDLMRGPYRAHGENEHRYSRDTMRREQVPYHQTSSNVLGESLVRTWRMGRRCTGTGYWETTGFAWPARCTRLADQSKVCVPANEGRITSAEADSRFDRMLGLGLLPKPLMTAYGRCDA